MLIFRDGFVNMHSTYNDDWYPIWSLAAQCCHFSLDRSAEQLSSMNLSRVAITSQLQRVTKTDRKKTAYALTLTSMCIQSGSLTIITQKYFRHAYSKTIISSMFCMSELLLIKLRLKRRFQTLAEARFITLGPTLTATVNYLTTFRHVTWPTRAGMMTRESLPSLRRRDWPPDEPVELYRGHEEISPSFRTLAWCKANVVGPWQSLDEKPDSLHVCFIDASVYG